MNPPEPNTAKGIVLTLIATLGIVLMNTCAKMSSVSMNPVEMIFYRFNLSSLVGLAAALCIALVAIVLRNLGRTDDPLTTVFYFLVIGSNFFILWRE